MTPDEVLALAREGNPKVLAAILNRSTQAHGISVRVAQKQNDVHILLEGATVERSDLLVKFIRDSLQKLKLNPAYEIKVYGRRQGARSVSWSETIDLRRESDAHQRDESQDEGFQPDKSQGDEPQVMTEGAIAPQTAPSTAHPAIETEDEFSGRSPESLDDNAVPETMTHEDHSAPSHLGDSMTNEPTDITTSSASIDSPMDGSSDIPDERSTEAALEEIESLSSSFQEPSSDEASGSMDALLDESPSVEDSVEDVMASSKPQATEMPGTPAAPEPTPIFHEPTPFMESKQPAAFDAQPTDTSMFDEQPDDTDTETFDFESVMKRPEALVIILFAIVLYIWQLYTALAKTAAPEGSVTGLELASRLGVSNSTISRRKSQPDFPAWAASLDPDGIAWAYTEGVFVPQMPDLA
jgi:hypothetical protein